MLPTTLALVDDDADFTEFLSQHLTGLGVDVRVFGDSNDLLTDLGTYDFGFYLVDLTLPGVDGVDLVTILRRRTNAGILVVSGRLGSEGFADALTAGADMYLAKPVGFEQIVLAIKAVHRRVTTTQVLETTWRVDRRASELVAPDGVRISLSDRDLAVMECFVSANGAVVTHQSLKQRLGQTEESDTDNTLHATIYRLRRRIERATPLVVPLQSQARVGYVFKAELRAA